MQHCDGAGQRAASQPGAGRGAAPTEGSPFHTGASGTLILLVLLENPLLGLNPEPSGAFVSAAITLSSPRSAGAGGGQRWGRNQGGDGNRVLLMWGEIS